MSPKLSVILPAHRYNSYLILAIKSILNQSFSEFELIVILNGNSTKYKTDLENEFSDSRLKVICANVANLVFALNLGINSAISEYIVRMDSDDVCKENRLAYIWEAINANPDVDVIGSSFDVIDSDGHFVKRSSLKGMDSFEIRRKLPFRCIIPHPTVVFKKASIINVGGYGAGQFSEDYDLWLRLLRSPSTKFLIIQHPLLDYRIHSSQATAQKNDLHITAFDLSLKIRELIITKNLVYLLGFFFTILDHFYRKFTFGIRNFKN